MQTRIASIQMTSTGDIEQNLKMVADFIQQAAVQGAHLVVLPEMFALMGMNPTEKCKYRETEGHGPIQDFLSKAAKQNQLWIVGGTLPIAASQESLRSRAACLVYNDKGEQVARYDKVHLFDANLRASQEAYLESSTTEPGDQVVVVKTPFGRLGLAVCYDVRFPELFRFMHEQEVEMIAIPTAFTYTTGTAHWDVLVRARAIENMAYVIASCQTGAHPNGRRTFGHSMIVNPWGEVIASLATDPGVIIAEINLDHMRQLREDFPVLAHRKWK